MSSESNDSNSVPRKHSGSGAPNDLSVTNENDPAQIISEIALSVLMINLTDKKELTTS